jgi:hypothetical protein
MQPNPSKGGLNRVLVDEQALRDRSPSLFQFNEKLLQDPNRLYQFKKFVEQEYADEHLSFYLVRKKKCSTAPARALGTRSRALSSCVCRLLCFLS